MQDIICLKHKLVPNELERKYQALEGRKALSSIVFEAYYNKQRREILFHYVVEDEHSGWYIATFNSEEEFVYYCKNYFELYRYVEEMETEVYGNKNFSIRKIDEEEWEISSNCP